MPAAQKALQASQWQEALKNLDDGRAEIGPDAVRQVQTIHDFKGFAEFRLGKYKEAEADYEAALATGEYYGGGSREDHQAPVPRGRAKSAVREGDRVRQAGRPSRRAQRRTISTSWRSSITCRRTARTRSSWADKALAASKKAGETPKENTYQFKLQCASDAGDTAGMEGPLVDLIKLTNKTTYWNTLLRLERQDERDDHNLLMIYRIMYNTNSMTADTDYIEMAQLLGDAALPGEAAAVLNKAMSTGIVKDEHKERTARLLKSLQDRADADKKGLAQQEAEAGKSAAGRARREAGRGLLRLRRLSEGRGRHQSGAAEGAHQAHGRGLCVSGVWRTRS